MKWNAKLEVLVINRECNILHVVSLINEITDTLKKFYYSLFSLTGILKNKVTYPPPLVDKNMKNRLREKLSDYNQSTVSSRTTSLGTNEGVRSPSDSGVTVKNVRREQSRDQLNGMAMTLHVGTGHADTSDSE